MTPIGQLYPTHIAVAQGKMVRAFAVLLARITYLFHAQDTYLSLVAFARLTYTSNVRLFQPVVSGIAPLLGSMAEIGKC